MNIKFSEEVEKTEELSLILNVTAAISHKMFFSFPFFRSIWWIYSLRKQIFVWRESNKSFLCQIYLLRVFVRGYVFCSLFPIRPLMVFTLLFFFCIIYFFCRSSSSLAQENWAMRSHWEIKSVDIKKNNNNKINKYEEALNFGTNINQSLSVFPTRI